MPSPSEHTGLLWNHEKRLSSYLASVCGVVDQETLCFGLSQPVSGLFLVVQYLALALHTLALILGMGLPVGQVGVRPSKGQVLGHLALSPLPLPSDMPAASYCLKASSCSPVSCPSAQTLCPSAGWSLITLWGEDGHTTSLPGIGGIQAALLSY